MIGVFEDIFKFAMPVSCPLCFKNDIEICATCLNNLKSPRLRCLKCGCKNPHGKYCFSCLSDFKPDLVLSCFAYDGQIRDLVHQFKYEDVTSLKKVFAKPISNLIKQILNFKSYTLVPIPLSKKRLRFRGYNQSLLIAQEISKVLHLEVCEPLEKINIKSSQVQTGSKQERRKNVKKAFLVKNDYEIPPNIFLIDDVITTGATVEEATKVLKKAGAKSVIVISLAMD
ncbi:MAG: ComF family protein [Candidatus Berkelbacteria bacterium]|nr:ComF family protein [Candidatus Berkelbacteria bacterium]